KLSDLEDRFGIEHTEVNPAFSSQECSACGYVDRRNRTGQSRLQCLWCGNEWHADLKAASNIGARRARPIGSLFQSKAAVLAGLVREFGERRMRAYGPRRTGSRGAPADPRRTNPYFSGVPPDVTRSSGCREASMKSGMAPALVPA
ncbi:MAG: zinc ribbon domain-containing protein, partial [Methylacidiphilaceae bacterium]|nr:zinc ribbon domain-containing protein [Candidatus Methylacidiphilaceae bacterium]